MIITKAEERFQEQEQEKQNGRNMCQVFAFIEGII
jgi:hypothetical protein